MVKLIFYVLNIVHSYYTFKLGVFYIFFNTCNFYVTNAYPSFFYLNSPSHTITFIYTHIPSTDLVLATTAIINLFVATIWRWYTLGQQYIDQTGG